MSVGSQVSMPRRVLHRSTHRLHIEYEDGYREEFFDKEQIRWILLENYSLVSFIFISNLKKFLQKKIFQKNYSKRYYVDRVSPKKQQKIKFS